jgi:hypothetical protein
MGALAEELKQRADDEKSAAPEILCADPGPAEFQKAAAGG